MPLFRILESKSYYNFMSRVVLTLTLTLEDITPPEYEFKILEIDMEPQTFITVEVFDMYSVREKIMGSIYIQK